MRCEVIVQAFIERGKLVERLEQHLCVFQMVFGGAQALMAHMKTLSMIRPMVGQPVAPPPSAASGRPIVKGGQKCLVCCVDFGCCWYLAKDGFIS